MDIRKADDLKTVADLITRSFTPRTAPRYQQLQGALIGSTADGPVAVAAFARSSLHPNGKKVIIAVLPEFRRKGFGSQIHSALLAGISPESLILVNGYTDQADIQAFYQKLGYRECNRCHCLEIDLMQIPKVPPNSRSKSYFELEQSGFNLNKVRDFLVERYISSHQWNPPCAIEDPIWKILREEQNIDPHHSFALIDGDKIIAASDGHTGGKIPGFPFAVGWAYADEQPALTKIDLFKAVLLPQLQKAVQTGYSTSYFEIDQAHPVKELLHWLPLKNHEIFVHHKLVIPI